MTVLFQIVPIILSYFRFSFCFGSSGFNEGSVSLNFSLFFLTDFVKGLVFTACVVTRFSFVQTGHLDIE